MNLQRHRTLAHPLSLTLVIYLLLTGLQALSSQMFLDGVVYAAIARNLASGQGEFWALHYTDAISPFHEHPPLAIWLHSLAYEAFGDKLLLDRLWGISLGGLSLGMVVLLTRRALAKAPARYGIEPREVAWFPALLWVAFPLTSWTLSHNLLEHTLLLFSLLGIYSLIAALQAVRLTAFTAWSVCAGLFLTLALLSKGPPALFLLTLPLGYRLLIHDSTTSRALLATLILLLVPAMSLLLIFWLQGEALSGFITHYVDLQLVRSIGGLRETSVDRFLLLETLLWNVVPALLTVLLAALASRTLPVRKSGPSHARPWAHLFLYSGVVASAPFLLFPKQMEWYLLPSLPLYALAIGLYFLDTGIAIERWLRMQPRRSALVRTLVILLAGVSLLANTRYAGVLDVPPSVLLRDALTTPNRAASPWQSEYSWQLFSRDILTYRQRLRTAALYSTCQPEIHDHWRFMAYLQRHLRGTLSNQPGGEYLVIDRMQPPCAVPAGCQSIQQQPAARYQLFQCPVFLRKVG